jgi:hypothetical protein
VNLLLNTDAAVKREEVGAAAEEDVLAVVDDFVDAWMKVGGGATAQIAPPFDEVHAQAGFGQGTGSAHAGNAAADYGDGAGGGLEWCGLQAFLRGSRPALVLSAVRHN